MAANKDGIILTNSLHSKFLSVNCLIIRRPGKQLSKAAVKCRFEKYLFGKYFSKLLSKEKKNKLLKKIPCFQLTPLNTFRLLRLKYENYFFRGILFKTFTKYSESFLKLQKPNSKKNLLDIL